MVSRDAVRQSVANSTFEHSAATGPQRAVCAIVAPKGGWVYAMPQHTATHAVVDFLHRWNDSLGMVQCEHNHNPLRIGTLPLAATPAFTLVFVANPFRRVLAHAAHCRAVPSSATSLLAPSERERSAFAGFVARLKPWHASSHSPCHPLRCIAYNLRYGFIWNQFRFLVHGFPTETLLIGRTAQLREHMLGALATLGYRVDGTLVGETLPFVNSRTASWGAFRVAPGASHEGGGQRGHGERHPLAAGRANRSALEAPAGWYTSKTAAHVAELFREDFRVFDFATDPHLMNAIERPDGSVPPLAVVSRSDLKARGQSLKSVYHLAGDVIAD
jgi:hypothetical protein